MQGRAGNMTRCLSKKLTLSFWLFAILVQLFFALFKNSVGMLVMRSTFCQNKNIMEIDR